MITQVFINKQRIQSGSIKTGEEHTYNDEQINFLVFYPFCQVAVVVLEFLTVYSEAGFEHSVIITDRLCQKLFGAAAHG